MRLRGRSNHRPSPRSSAVVLPNVTPESDPRTLLDLLWRSCAEHQRSVSVGLVSMRRHLAREREGEGVIPRAITTASGAVIQGSTLVIESYTVVRTYISSTNSDSSNFAAGRCALFIRPSRCR
jgi:hypothetical protein